MSDIVARYRCMQFQGKLSKLNKIAYFGPDLAPLDSNLDRQFFFKNLVLLFTRYHGQLSPCAISEKTNHPILRKLSDRRTSRQTDRQTDGRK